MELNTLLLPMGIIPSLFVLYFIVGRYEGRFREKLVFLAFIVGFVIGVIIYAIEGMIVYPIVSEAPYIDIILFFSFIFSFLEQIAKFATLNHPKMREEGVPIYGGTFGLGFSSVFAPLLFGKSIEITLENIPLMTIPFAVILINCSTGILIGVGIKRVMKMKYFVLSLLISFLMWISLLVAIIYSISWNTLLSMIFSIYLLLFSIIIFAVTYKEQLPFGMLSRREIRQGML